MAFKDSKNRIIDLLKDKILTADNKDIIAEISKELDSLSDEHDKTETELTSVKDKLVDVVKNTSFKKEEIDNQDKGETDEPMSIDDASEEALNEILANRR